MRSRALRIAILAWTAWWFVGFIPAHQRGMIRADAAPPASAPASSISPTSGCGGACTMSESGSPDPADAPLSNCGVCHVVAKLDLPQPLNLDLAPLAFAEAAPAARFLPLCSRDADPHYLGRAPPRIAS